MPSIPGRHSFEGRSRISVRLWLSYVIDWVVIVYVLPPIHRYKAFITPLASSSISPSSLLPGPPAPPSPP